LGPKEGGSGNVVTDARSLSDAITELNISRRNVSIYPKDHPAVERSLKRSFEFLQKIFEARPEITLAVAKDALIIGDSTLDKKNLAFREFALHLNRLNIAFITLLKGITADEIYEFHGITSEKIIDDSPDRIQERFNDHPMPHIKVGFIDYSAFSFVDGKTEPEAQKAPLWERYIFGLLEGRISASDASGQIGEIAPEIVADFLNSLGEGGFKENACDEVIAALTEADGLPDLKRLTDFIMHLTPGLRRRFLSATGRVLGRDIENSGYEVSSAYKDDIRSLVNVMNEQRVAISETLRNLLAKLTLVQDDALPSVSYNGNLLADDIVLSFDIVHLLDTGRSLVTESYKKELQRLIDHDASSHALAQRADDEKAYGVDYVENTFYDTALEILLSEITTEDDHDYFMQMLQEQAERLIWTGQYNRIRETLKVLTTDMEHGPFQYSTEATIQYFHSADFLAKLVDSLKIVGRQAREEARVVCEEYGEEIIRPMIDALVKEESPTVRKFFLGLLSRLGNKVVPEAVTRLGDSRWYVKRNMLYLLSEIKGAEAIPHIRPYCRHENRKVSFEAIKYLLNVGDSYGVDALRDYLHGEKREDSDQAIALAGALKVRELIPDLLQLLKKRAVSSSDVYNKIPIVKVLGEIGDAGCLQTLKDILSSKSILFRNSFDRLKEEVYRSLKNYPFESIGDLIGTGMKSKNDIIRAESVRLSRTGGKRG